MSRRSAPVLLTAVAFAAGVVAGASLATGNAGAPPLAQPEAASRASDGVTGPKQGEAIYPAEVLRVIDGDTFEARVRIWPGVDITTKVRLRGIDAPELRAPCQEARARAEAARTALTALLAEGEVSLRAVGLDKYGGRILAAAATRARVDVAEALMRAGHAQPYHGGRRVSGCLAAGRR